jgi:hypothetical protein
MRGVSKCSQPDMRLGTVGGVTEWVRIAMLTSAGRVQRCRAPVMDRVLLLARPELMRAAPLGGLRAKKDVAGTSVIGATLTSGKALVNSTARFSSRAVMVRPLRIAASVRGPPADG